MAVINIDDVLQIVQTWDAPLASVAQNVWHLIQVSGVGANSDVILQAVADQQATAFGLMESRISDEFSVSLFEMRQWDFTLKRFDGIETLAAAGMVGTNVSDYEPHGVAALGRILTDTARRQGGTFIPGISENGITDGVLDAGVETDVALYLVNFDTPISVAGGVLNWCTFNTEPLSPVFETAAEAIQSVIVNSLPSYLSKRKPGVGL